MNDPPTARLCEKSIALHSSRLLAGESGYISGLSRFAGLSSAQHFYHLIDPHDVYDSPHVVCQCC